MMTFPRRLLLALTAAFFVTSPAFSNDDPAARGPAIGDRVAFVSPMTAANGGRYALDDLHGDKGTLLMFNRSLGWCPYCKRQAEDLIDRAEEFSSAGYGLTVITYDTPLVLSDYAKKEKPSFPLLSDADSKTIIDWGLLNEKYEPGSFAYGIPHPILIIVDTNNVVTAKFAEEGYKDRPALDVVLEALQH